jgi:hypothetical protein
MVGLGVERLLRLLCRADQHRVGSNSGTMSKCDVGTASDGEVSVTACQGISGYEPLCAKRRERLQKLRTGDGRILPDYLRRQISCELYRLELILKQIDAVEAERDALMLADGENTKSPVAMLMGLRGIGAECASTIWLEGLFRSFENRRQIAAYAGLAPTAERYNRSRTGYYPRPATHACGTGYG